MGCSAFSHLEADIPEFRSPLMAKSRLEARTKKELVQLAKKKGIASSQSMSKDELVRILSRTANEKPKTPSTNRARREAVGAKRTGKAASIRPQIAAARDTSNSTSPEEEVERSKYEVGVPTKHLSTKAPKDLPSS